MTQKVSLRLVEKKTTSNGGGNNVRNGTITWPGCLLYDAPAVNTKGNARNFSRHHDIASGKTIVNRKYPIQDFEKGELP